MQHGDQEIGQNITYFICILQHTDLSVKHVGT